MTIGPLPMMSTCLMLLSLGILWRFVRIKYLWLNWGKSKEKNIKVGTVREVIEAITKKSGYAKALPTTLLVRLLVHQYYCSHYFLVKEKCLKRQAFRFHR